MIYNKLFKKEYNLYAFDLKRGNEKYTIQLFQNKKEAREYLKRLIDSQLNDLSESTLNETTLINDYLEKRRYSYKIKNDKKFNELDYIRNNASRVYKEFITTQ